ncbi:MAG: NRDE family protein [Ignavibacteriaceae bacterium]|nr:NRDE family protein [Ignavibacteriaceae bacterium]
MCLIVFAYKTQPGQKLLLAANRDEFYKRPAEPAARRGEIICGIDLKAGGTWLGVTRGGRFAALTNFRDLKNIKPNAPSRGALVINFLEGKMTPAEYAALLKGRSGDYNGFNLLVMAGEEMIWYSNITDEAETLKPGIYGLSNAHLNTPWRKNIEAKEGLAELITKGNVTEEELLALMQNRTHAPDDELPDTGAGFALEKLLSPVFIQSTGYGTRCTTLLRMSEEDEIIFREVSYDEMGGAMFNVRFTMKNE